MRKSSQKYTKAKDESTRVEVGDEESSREFDLNAINKGFPTNYIRTTKYNAITFLPFSLLKQFSRLANIYFLIIAILSLIPEISSISPVTAILPLVFVLVVSMIREGLEDFSRYRSDRASNNKKVMKLNEDNEFANATSKDLQVGDIVLIFGDDTFAADIVLLKSSNGVNAFIQTSSLDGEKNLKKRFVPKGIEKYTKPEDEKSYMLGGTCTTLPPEKDLHSFTGKLEVGGKNYALNIEQLLLKDSKLKNTGWIIGTVAFTGKESKVMLNSQKSRNKVSNLENKLNKVIIFLFFVQILICIVLSAITAIYDNVKDDNQDYYLGNDESNENVFLNFFSYFLLLSTLIPISLIVTLEVIKTIQAYFISNDAQMYDVDADGGTNVSTTTINEELGQVTYVFSDKTGTLTQNIMEFRALAVGEETYGRLGGESFTRRLTSLEQKKELETNFKSDKLNRTLQTDPIQNDVTKIKSQNGRSEIVFNNDQERAQEIMKLLSLCHDCEAEESVVNGTKIKFYQGESPDEITLVDFAKDQGFEFNQTNDGKIFTQVSSASGLVEGDKIDQKEYKVHKKVKFTSDRARMSVLFTDPDDGLIKLYIKGADSKIKERLDPKNNDDKVKDHVDDFLSKAAVCGLRTLLLAMKVIDKDELRQIEKDIQDAEKNVNTSAENIQKVIEGYESNLILVGATCVEDKLQENVADTLEDFRRAGINVWMLTGDKLETAKNIGYSCKLLTDEMVIYQAQGPQEAKERFTESLVDDNIMLMKELKPRAIVFDSGALSYLTANPQSLKHFINIAKTCNAVVCSRASPAQKADIVRMIKNDDPTNITLSIGDGANDVSMILEADIGIGIYGKEGVNAAQASDFAIHQFKFIWDLVLYHGRYNYMRNSELILYFFYKNIIFTVPQVYFAYISDFSAQTVFDDFYISFYNLFFTSLPIIVRCVFETDVDWQVYKGEKRNRIKNFTPRLYYVGNRKMIFTYLNY